jgi:hypothetical protein
MSSLMSFTGNLDVTHGGIFIAQSHVTATYVNVDVGMTPGWYFSFAILIPM